MARIYEYVGGRDLMPTQWEAVHRVRVAKSENVQCWIQETEQILSADNSVTATFVVDLGGELWIADRHSEHVHCARGGSVLAAGEITFIAQGNYISVVSVTNQSTGYCPEPESWQAVQPILTSIFADVPENFTVAFIFRCCPQCDTINIIKEDIWECAFCNGELPMVRNL